MRSYLNFLKRRNVQLDQFQVITKSITEKYSGTSVNYVKIVTEFQGIKNGKKLTLDYMDTGIDSLWGGALDSILTNITNPLNDFKHFRWKEIKRPVVEYWKSRQKAEIAKQKRNKAKTIWTPTGDYTLWRLAEFITNIMLVKYCLIKGKSILANLEGKKIRGFEKDFTDLVLRPLKTYSEIEKVVYSSQQDKHKIESIIDLIVSFGRYSSGPYERPLDPEFADKTPFLSKEEEMELSALWNIYEEENKTIEDNKSLSKIEKRIKINDFWDSIQGKRLNYLNSHRSYGGTLGFEEREKRKNKRSKEISEDIEHLLYTWELEDKLVEEGLKYYQYLYQKEAYKRWRSNKEFRDAMDKARAEVDIVKNILQGNWDSNSLTLFTVIVGLAISVGFGIASITESHRVELAVGGSILSIIVLIFIVKRLPIRKRILALMNRVLS